MKKQKEVTKLASKVKFNLQKSVVRGLEKGQKLFDNDDNHIGCILNINQVTGTVYVKLFNIFITDEIIFQPKITIYLADFDEGELNGRGC